MDRPEANSRGDVSPRLFLGLLCAVYLAHVVWLACAAEDAHITYRFARHVAAGRGFVWNSGEAPIEGFTTVLWVLVSAAAIRLGTDVVLVTQVLGVVSAFGTLLLTYRISVLHAGASERLALVPCAFLALSGSFATWAASGMETVTFGFFLLAAFAAYLRHSERLTRASIASCAVLLMIAALLRPEAVLLAALLVGWMVLEGRTDVRRLGHAAVFLTVFVPPLVLLELLRIRTFGDYLPNTYHAKTGGGVYQVLRGAVYVFYFGFTYLAGLAPLAILAMSRKEPGAHPSPGWLESARRAPALPLAGAFTALYLAYLVAVGGDYMAMYRFVTPVLPFLYLLLVPIVAPLVSVDAAPGVRRATVAALFVALAATLVPSTPLERHLFAAAPLQHGTYRGVVLERWHVARLRRIAEFFAEHAPAEGASIATDAIGVIGFQTELSVHDLSGLTDRHIARTPTGELGKGLAGHERLDLNYSFHRLPTYFLLARELAPVEATKVIRPGATMNDVCQVLATLYPRSIKILGWMRDNEAFVREHYRLVNVPLLDLENDEKGYLAFLERVH